MISILPFTSYYFTAVSALYVKNDFTRDDKQVLDEIFENVKLALKASLRENHWMSAETKKAALAKAEAMIRRLGYPDYLDEEGAVDEFYAQFPVNEDDTFLETLVDWIPQHVRDFGQKLHQNFTRQNWTRENVAAVSFELLW